MALAALLISNRRQEMPFDCVGTESERTTTLKRAKATIADPKNWCQRAFLVAKLDGGKQYCALGSLMRAGHDTLAAEHLLKDAAMEILGPGFVSLCRHPVAFVNDQFDHATVMKMFDAAIEESERADVETALTAG
jgi:hypothetical protein